MINDCKITRKKLVQDWRSRLALECPEQSVANTDSIIGWLLVSRFKQYERLNPKEQKIVLQEVDYRYQILRQRYLGIPKERAYRNLITRLGSLVTSRPSIQIWIAKSHNHQRIMLDVLQKVIQELLQSNNYMQQQITCIAKCTTDDSLKNALLFASLEEYCLGSIGNQQLFVYHFINYLKKKNVLA
ncbi:MAG: hypothetical protein PUP93_27740 [Rhizonema sp. NSF051]|nr:hypothetical protein [Rhizonema sp. NSF051]